MINHIEIRKRLEQSRNTYYQIQKYLDQELQKCDVEKSKKINKNKQNLSDKIKSLNSDYENGKFLRPTLKNKEKKLNFSLAVWFFVIFTVVVVIGFDIYSINEAAEVAEKPLFTSAEQILYASAEVYRSSIQFYTPLTVLLEIDIKEGYLLYSLIYSGGMLVVFFLAIVLIVKNRRKNNLLGKHYKNPRKLLKNKKAGFILKRKLKKADKDAKSKLESDIEKLRQQANEAEQKITEAKQKQKTKIEEKYRKKLTEQKERINIETQKLKDKLQKQDKHNINRPALYRELGTDIIEPALKDISVSNFDTKILGGTYQIKDEVTGSNLNAPFFIEPLNNFSLYLKKSKYLLNNNGDKVALYEDWTTFLDEFVDNTILRSLLSIPINKLKLTLIDPAELGGQFSKFTSLPKDVYGGMVVTNEKDITEALSVNVRFIETIVQQYLQDTYSNITEYNKANDIFEPYHIIVIKDFPNEFNLESISLLEKIIQIGGKAGVGVIVEESLDPSWPYDLDETRIAKLCDYDLDHFISHSYKYGKQMLMAYRYGNLQNSVEESGQEFKKIIQTLSDGYEDASRLIVPYKVTDTGEWWKKDSGKSLSVEIGVMATDQFYLTYNNADSNQSLLIGKPGSGKSNLLHTILLNTFTEYSPDEVEVYLIDFKGGVEFNVYTKFNIPHIKTIAIESDREFGLSVLSGVEKELLAREAHFSEAGVQNIHQFREKFPNYKMPRILMIVDEFQEFFVYEDEIKAKVNDKLDRIVRKGRAFGVNILFASQTLQGSSIAKSTRDLIGIRMALMVSDQDANEIMDDRNNAAKDLSRPGEGIYNDEAGKVSGNKKFQAYFIDRSGIEETLDKLHDYIKEQDLENTKAPIVFRGSAKVHIERAEHPLSNIKVTDNPVFLKLWMGKPLSVDDDVFLILERSVSQNIFILGNDTEINTKNASSILTSVLVQSGQETKVYVLNALSKRENNYELFNNIVSLSDNSTEIREKGLNKRLTSMKELVEKRLEQEDFEAPSIYLFLIGFGRMRTFRREGYEEREETLLLKYLLENGPEVGIHIIIHVNSFNNALKNLDEQTILRTFNHRISSKLNEENSFKMFSSKVASTLKKNRSLCFNDLEGSEVKYIPYETVDLSWLNSKANTFK